MTSEEVRSLFPAWVRVINYDNTYAKPTNSWLFNEFIPWFKTNRWQRDKSKWDRKNDCDNFARTFCVYVQDAHSDGKSDAEALAVGEFCYVGSTHVQGPHAIVCAITEDGLIFIEPQSGQRLALTPTEIQSCFHVAF